MPVNMLNVQRKRSVAKQAACREGSGFRGDGVTAVVEIEHRDAESTGADAMAAESRTASGSRPVAGQRGPTNDAERDAAHRAAATPEGTDESAPM